MPQRQAPRVKAIAQLQPKPSQHARWAGAFAGALAAFCTWFILDDLVLFDVVPPLRSQHNVVLYFLAAGAMFGYARRARFFWLSSALLLLFWLTVAFTTMVKTMVARCMEKTPDAEIARGANAVIVLGSAVQPNGDLGPAAWPRLLRGMELVRVGRAPVMVLTEIPPPAGSQVRAVRNLIRNLKIDVPLLPVPGFVRDTHDEAVGVAGLAKARGWKRVFMVTSPVHTHRAAETFRMAMAPLGVQVFPVACQEPGFDASHLKVPEDRRRAFGACMREFVGMAVYRRRGWVK